MYILSVALNETEISRSKVGVLEKAANLSLTGVYLLLGTQAR